MKLNKLYYVKWSDSYSIDNTMEWREYKEHEKPEIHICESAGWLTKISKDCIRITPHIAKYYGCGDLVIPKSAIIKIKKLWKQLYGKHQK